jgi:hypothetical protein
LRELDAVAMDRDFFRPKAGKNLDVVGHAERRAAPFGGIDFAGCPIDLNPSSAESLELLNEKQHAARAGELDVEQVAREQQEVGFFPQHQQRQIRAMLAATLKGVISQRLVRRADGSGRVAAVEVLVNTGRAEEMILNPDETARLSEVIHEGAFYGMQTFDQALLAHVQAGRVTAEDALRAANRPQDLRLMLAQAKGSESVPRAAELPTPHTTQLLPT